MRLNLRVTGRPDKAEPRGCGDVPEILYKNGRSILFKNNKRLKKWYTDFQKEINSF